MSAEVVIEDGIGETRAIVLDAGGGIVEAHVERDRAPGEWRCGDVDEVRLTTILGPGVRGIVAVGGREALLEPLPRALTEGIALRVEIVREGLGEAGRVKLAKAVATTAPVRAGPTLAERLRARGFQSTAVTAFGRDRFEEAGWSEVVEAALDGRVGFPGGSLTISPVPGMTVIDVDGALPPVELALAAAGAAASAIRRFDLAGSIGIDFPTVADRATRTRLGEVLDAGLPAPFERTAVNGFGFVQIVRPRHRPSLVERLRGDRVATAGLRLLRQAERGPGTGARTLAAAPAVADWLTARPKLTAELARRLGVAVALHADPRLAIAGGHVASLA